MIVIDSVTEDQFQELQSLQSESKFTETAHYPGAPTEKIRLRCEAAVNDFLQFVEAKVREGTDETSLYSCARALETSFHREDTEERERVGDYIGDAMRILELHEWIENV